MKPDQSRKVEYRLYFSEGQTRFFLADIIAHDGMEHPQFTVEWRRAMTFHELQTAIAYGRRLRAMGYQMHVL